VVPLESGHEPTPLRPSASGGGACGPAAPAARLESCPLVPGLNFETGTDCPASFSHDQLPSSTLGFAWPVPGWPRFFVWSSRFPATGPPPEARRPAPPSPLVVLSHVPPSILSPWSRGVRPARTVTPVCPSRLLDKSSNRMADNTGTPAPLARCVRRGRWRLFGTSSGRWNPDRVVLLIIRSDLRTVAALKSVSREVCFNHQCLDLLDHESKPGADLSATRGGASVTSP